MTIRRESTGNVTQCDGCGRTDSGPGGPISAMSVPVHDPNVGGTVEQHLCPHCRANRGLTDAPLVIGDWVPAQPAPSSETDARSARRTKRGDDDE